MARGHSQRVDSRDRRGRGAGRSGSFTFALPLKPFVDGGWYWYDVVAGDHGVTVDGAEWTAQVPADRAEHGTVDICITTMLPDMSAQLLGQLGDADELRPYLDTVIVMDQGKDKVTDSEYFPRRRGRPRATSCASSCRATWAAPAATPAASSRASARAPRRTR